MRATRTIFSALFIAVALCYSGRFVIIMSVTGIQKNAFRSEALNNHDYQVLEIPAKQLFRSSGNFEWKDDNKEIVVNNKHYEVLDVKINNSIAVLHLASDITETNLFAFFLSQNGSDIEFESTIKLLLEDDITWFERNQDVLQLCSTSYPYHVTVADCAFSTFACEVFRPPIITIS